jgi:signal transduction histidine kinase
MPDPADGQGALLRGLAHELRAPLQSLLGHLDLVRDGTLGPLTTGQAESLAEVAAGAERLLSVCDDVLQVARIDSGHETVIRKEIALDGLLSREVAAMEPLARRAGLRIRCECTPGLRIDSDEAKLARVVTNLVSNAVKYTPRGEVAVRAERLPEGGCAIEVRDTGIGIAPEHHESIFEEYVRLQGSAEGAGLGLPIVRRLVELLGGSLSLDSEPGRGTRVRVLIPR